MTDAAWNARVEELEGRIEVLEVLVAEARVLASAERAAADAMERRMMGGGIAWNKAAEA